MTDLLDGWTLERICEYRREEVLLIDPAERRVVLRTESGERLLEAVVILDFNDRYLIRDAERQWYLGLGDDDTIMIWMDCGDVDLEHAMWEL